MAPPPKTQKQWTIEGRDGFDSLKFTTDAPVPELGDHDVLVQFHAASLNYRDLIIPKGKYPFATRTPCVPCSDGAGTVTAVGPRVTRFKPGTHVLPLFNQTHYAGPCTPSIQSTGVGGTIDGTLRQYGSFNEEGLVSMPSSLTFKEASTLTCAGLTAWNALYGLIGKALKPGDWVLTQGTGGVSTFALQFAKAAGAKVIATTSSSEKAERLKALGADHVINYKETPSWGQSAKDLTPGSLGVNHILEVGGPNTIAQSLQAITPEGVISIIGFVGGYSKDTPGMLDALSNLCTVRGILVGSRLQFEEMNRAIEVNGIKPVVDGKGWGLEEGREAYGYMWEQKHFGKVVIGIDDGEGRDGEGDGGREDGGGGGASKL